MKVNQWLSSFRRSLSSSNTLRSPRLARRQQRRRAAVHMELMEVRQLLSATAVTGDALFPAEDIADEPGFAVAIGDVGEDTGNAVAVDRDGNSYVVGTLNQTSLGTDTPPRVDRTGNSSFFVRSYSADRGLRWIREFGSDGANVATGVAFGPNGHVYVTGNFQGTLDFGAFNYDDGRGIRQASDTNQSGFDIFVLQLTANGEFVDVSTFGHDSPVWDYATDIAVDADGGILVTGWFGGGVDFDPDPGASQVLTASGNQDIFLLRLNATGELDWAKTIGSSRTTGFNDYGTDVEVDSDGNVYLAGRIFDTVDFDSEIDRADGSDTLIAGTDGDAFVASFNQNGDFRWVRRVGLDGGEESSAREIIQGLTATSLGTVAAVGEFRGDNFDPGSGVPQHSSVDGGSDIFITEFDAADGTWLWSRAIGAEGDDRGRGIASDADGGLHVVGFYNGTVDFDAAGAGANGEFIRTAGTGGAFADASDAAEQTDSTTDTIDDHFEYFLVPTVTESPESRRTLDQGLPESITDVPVGSTYFVEVWFRDALVAPESNLPPQSDSRGVVGTGVNLLFDTSLGNGVSIDISNEDGDVTHPWDIPFSFPGSIDNANGLIDSLGNGGLILPTDLETIGVNEFARMGTIEFTADSAGLQSYEISLVPSATDGYVPETARLSDDDDVRGVVDPETISVTGATVLHTATSQSGAGDGFLVSFDRQRDIVAVNTGGGPLGDDAVDVAVDATGRRHITGYFQETATFANADASGSLTSAGLRDAFFLAVPPLESGDPNGDVMDVAVEVSDLNGNRLEEIELGQQFRINIYAQDLRSLPAGVTAAYADVLYDTGLIDVTDIEHAFEGFLDGRIDEASGIVDEVGGTLFSEPADPDAPQLVFSLVATARELGELTVSTDAGDDDLSENTLLGEAEDVRTRTRYGALTISIVGQPELVATAFDAVDDFLTEGRTIVEFTVTNLGNGPSDDFDVEIRHSDDDRIGDADDDVVATIRVQGLAAGESRTIREEVQLDLTTLRTRALRDNPAGEDTDFVSTSRDLLGLVVDPANEIAEDTEADFVQGQGFDRDDVTYFPFDVNGDGRVRPTDVNAILSRLGLADASTVQDLDGDGRVNLVDAIILSNRRGYRRNDSVQDDIRVIEPPAGVGDDRILASGSVGTVEVVPVLSVSPQPVARSLSVAEPVVTPESPVAGPQSLAVEPKSPVDQPESLVDEPAELVTAETSAVTPARTIAESEASADRSASDGNAADTLFISAKDWLDQV